MKTKVHAISGRVRNIHDEILRLCPPDTRRNVRVALPEARDHSAMVRVTHVDALDVARLSRKFPDVRIFARDSTDGGACIDVYVPYKRPAHRHIARLLSVLSYLLSIAALVRGLQTFL